MAVTTRRQLRLVTEIFLSSAPRGRPGTSPRAGRKVFP
jgi:hypothetical protein